MEDLDFAIPALVEEEQVAESPLLDLPDLGLRLAARQVRHDGQVLAFDLLVSYLLDAAEAGGYQRLAEAVAVCLEDAEGGRAAASSLLDPHKRYPRRQGPNFRGPRPPPAGGPTHAAGGWVLPLEIPLALPAWEGPSFYVTALLAGHVSNTLAFDLAAGSASSWLGGAPCPVEPAGEEEPPEEADEAAVEGTDAGPAPLAAPAPPPRPPVLSLVPRKRGPHGPAEPILLDATLALPPEELEAFGAEGWLRALFAWSHDPATGSAHAGHWLGDRAAFPDDFQLRGVGGQARAVATAAVDLGELLGVRLPPGRHRVQLSARHHRSEPVVIECI